MLLVWWSELFSYVQNGNSIFEYLFLDCVQISESLYNPGPRKMFFKAQAIHINAAAVVNAPAEEEQENIDKIKRFAEKHQ